MYSDSIAKATPVNATLNAAPPAALANYTITNAGAEFTINKRLATWTTNANSKTYGTADPLGLTTGSGTNFVSADGVTATYSRAAGETVLGGPYHITATLSATVAGALNNYTITNTGADFTIKQASTSTVVISTLNPSIAGQLVTFVATVTDSSPGSTGTPTGSVQFTYNGAYIGTATLVRGSASFSTFPLVSGTVVAGYLGDNNFKPSDNSAAPLIQNVTPAPVVTLSPDALAFGLQNLKTPSTPLTVTLTNIGTAPLSPINIQINGANSSDFTQTNNCPSALGTTPPGNSCVISVTFIPQDTGFREASLSISDNANGSPQLIGLIGSGQSVVISDFTRTSINGGNYIWFDSVFSVKGPKDKDGHEIDESLRAVKVYFTNQTIRFTANNTSYQLPVPDAVLTFDPGVTSATTTVDPINNRWVTRIPSVEPNSHEQEFDVDGEIFSSGLAYQVPAVGLPGRIKHVAWMAFFTTDTPGVTLRWE